MVEEVHLGLYLLDRDRGGHRSARPMDEAPGAHPDPVREKLVALAMAGAVRQNRALAEHGGSFRHVPGLRDGLYGAGIPGGDCDPVLFPTCAAQ